MPAKIKEDELGLLTQEQAAKLLRVREHTLMVWRTSGRYQLPYVQIGRVCYYRMSDIQEWINRRVVTPGVEAQAQ